MRQLAIATACLALTGCAHYYLPASQLETPETLGPEQVARLEILGIQSGTDLVSEPQIQPTDPETGKTPDPTLEATPANYTFGAWININPQLDIGVRFEPYAPALVRVKYQLMGDPESTSV